MTSLLRLLAVAAVLLGASLCAPSQAEAQSGPIYCTNYVYKHITTATDTLAVSGVAGKSIYICGAKARAAGTATWALSDSTATGSCTGLTQIDILNTEAVNTGIQGIVPIWSGLKTTAAHALCITSTGTGGVDVGISYTQF